ncbi:MAG: amidohydrolase family protein [Armatimonadetes bacterium]|nr:amidohydrolase family protein [Armatimonadota bacterium]
MPELTYFDAHAVIGARPLKPAAERWSLDHVLADLELAGIAGALVRHSQALHYEPMHGNLRLIEEIAPYRDRLFPCWSVVPPVANDFPEPEQLLALMDKHDVRAAIIHPKTNGLPLHAPLLQPLAGALAEAQRLLLVSYGEFGDFEPAHRFLSIFEHGPVLLLDHTWSQWREIQLLMDLHPNLHLEFSAFQANRAIEYFGERYGFERCLFGTGQPMKAPGAARAFLDFRLCDDASAAKVAGGNLRRLLGGVGPTEPPAPGAWHDSITAEERAGEPLSCLLLDAHCHVLHDGASFAGERYVMVKGDAAGLLEVARRMGTDATALMSWNGTVSMDAPAGNQVTAAAVSQAPDEYVGLLTLNPTHQSPAEMQAQIEEYHGRLGFRGLKPYQRTVIPYNHASFDPWWEFGNEHHLYGLFHISVGGVNAVLDIAQRYPNFHCLIAHSGGSYAFADQVISVAQQAPNIYAELTLTPVTNGVVEYLCEAIGVERVLYGTDAPMRDPRPQLGWVVFTRLPEADKRKILGENFQRILLDGRLPGHQLPAGVRSSAGRTAGHR